MVLRLDIKGKVKLAKFVGCQGIQMKTSVFDCTGGCDDVVAIGNTGAIDEVIGFDVYEVNGATVLGIEDSLLVGTSAGTEPHHER